MRNRINALVGAGLLVIAGAGPALAAPFLLEVDPSQSWIEVGAGSTVEIGLPAPLGARSMAVESQVGALPGASGDLLADGTVSDGLRTTLSGEVLVDVTATQFAVLSERSLLEPATSGSWLPGPPGSEATPSAAQLGLFFEDAAIGLAGSGALREALIGLSVQTAPLSAPVAGVQTIGPAGLIFRLSTGLLDYDLGLDGAEGRTEIDTTIVAFQQNAFGTLENLGGGRRRLTLPIDFELNVGEFLLPTPVPTALVLQLSGQIVAETVPEPATAVLVLGALAWTVSSRRHAAKEVTR